MGWKPEAIWKNETAFIIAGGPSVANEDLSILNGRRVIVVNSSFMAFPNADFLIFADTRWWNHNRAGVRSTFKGKIVGATRHCKDEKDVLVIKRAKPAENKPISTDPSFVTIERTTLQSAINLAVHLGASRIVLLGADMGRDAEGRAHHHIDHPWKNKEGNRTWDRQMEHLRSIGPSLQRLGVEIVNTSMVSRIDWWPKQPLPEAAALPNIKRKPEVGTSDSREYDQLKRRKFRPYSLGHRRMYEVPLETVFKHNKFRVFEAGFGIGWGLDQMVGRGNISEYVGCEPNLDSFNYTKSRHGTRDGVTLINKPFITELADQYEGKFDHAFCIEVIEHVPAEYHLEFLQNLKRMAPKVWFSTPDIDRSPKEGVRTTAEWEQLLGEAGFTSVVVDKRHWTHLYACS